MRNIRIKILSILLIIINWSHAQSNNYLSYGVEDGLIQSQIESIIQDYEGKLWIGTIGGLTIYDGVDFKSFTTKEGLSEDWISCFYSDKDENIWMGHWGGGITKFSKSKDQFEILQFEKELQYRKIIKFLEIGQEDMLIFTEGAGVFRYTNGKLNAWSAKLKSLDINDAILDKDKALIWLATDKGVEVVNIGQTKIQTHLLDTSKGLPTNTFSSISFALENEVWLGSKSEGIVRLNRNITFEEITNKSNLSNELDIITTNQGLTSNEIENILGTSSGQVWIGTKNNGINTFKPDNNKLSNNFKSGQISVFGNSFELKYYNANTFFEDRENNIWIGTEIGLNKYLGDLFKIYDESNVLINNLIWSTYIDDNENLWIGSSQGISRLTFKKKNGKTIFQNPDLKNYSTQDGLAQNLIISITEDAQGNIWAGTENNGISIISKDGIIKNITTADGLADNTVYSLAKDKKGNIWAGTKKGACKISSDDKNVEIINIQNGLGGNKVFDIFCDSKGRVWFGILGGELSVWQDGQINKFGRKDGFFQKFVVSIAEDQDKNIWIGTYQGGMYQYNGSEFRHYTTVNGLLTDFPQFILPDNDNNIWIGHNKGIQKYNPKEDRFYNYGKKNGFSGLETNENAVSIDKNNNIWFGTIKGLVKFAPYKEKLNLIEPLTKIDGLQILLQDASFPANNTFAYDQNNITFEVIGISLTNPKEVTYSYRLIGNNDAWSPKQKNRTFNFSGLQPGTYTFEVKAYNNSGVENENPISYSFIVSPPWYNTWWARVSFLVIILAGIIIYIKIREHKLKQRQAYLEEQVALRTEQLQKEKEVVESQNLEIEKKNKHITDSINYAKRIQGAVLPPNELIKQVLPQSFVYFNPRDIVSGDFYWVSQFEDKILYAAADCTGHGVPGAFMSLVGHNLLDKIVNEYQIGTPAKLLDKLSQEIVSVLRQDQDSGVKDGMDISVCAIDFSQKKLEFAGAYNPLFIARKGELIELDGDRIPIGKSYTGKQEFYKHYDFDLEEGDCLYTFSDGYVDQIGGKNGKKLMFKRFRKLILEIADMPIDKQEARLAQAMKNWKGDYIQYDDMIIFGVKI